MSPPEDLLDREGVFVSLTASESGWDRGAPHIGDSEPLRAYEGGGREMNAPLDRALAKKPRQKRWAPDPKDARVVIRIDPENVNGTVAAAAAALMVAELGLYQRGSKIVFIGAELKPTADGPKVEAQVIRERGDHALVCDLARAAIFVKFDARSGGDAPIEPPLALVHKLREQPEVSDLPILSGVVNTPSLRRDGSILTKPGYDPATGFVFDPLGIEFPAILENPSKAAALKARDEIFDVIKTFPFVAEADKSAGLSMILSAVARNTLDAAPMHGVSATAAGTGKGKLVNVASVIATGRPAPVIAEGGDGSEFEKRLAAELFEGAQIIAIDNAEKPIGGQLLNQILTEPTVKPRLLGKSENIPIPNKTFVTATGNNLQVIGDMTRRTIICSLDAKMERPELRQFDFEPVQRAKDRRPQLVVAALTLLRAFKLHGRPSAKPPLGSFEQWSSLIRDAILWIDMADPTDTMEQVRDSDPRLAMKRAIFEQWHDLYQDSRKTVAAVADESPGTPLFDALFAVAGERGQINRQILGKWLRSARNTIADGKRLVKASEGRGGIAVWQMQKL